MENQLINHTSVVINTSTVIRKCDQKIFFKIARKHKEHSDKSNERQLSLLQKNIKPLLKVNNEDLTMEKYIIKHENSVF